jgi:hypothetical protein
MSRRSNQKRKALQKKKRKLGRRPPVLEPAIIPPIIEIVRELFPSAPTFVRMMQVNLETREKLAQVAISGFPSLMELHAETIHQIESAPGIQEVLHLAGKATGIAEPVWLRRVRGFGPSVAPVIGEWFRSLVVSQPDLDHTVETEKCVVALRWCGEAGIEPLLDCWDVLDDYGRSIASAMLGLLGARQAADKIWDFYQQVKNNYEEHLFVGALWGLIDLEDPRAADALIELLMEEEFYELYGFLSRVGDHRAVLPLLALGVKGDDFTREKAQWALTSIGHRIGRSALLETLQSAAPPDSPAQERLPSIADKILSHSAEEAAEYFGLFYEEKLSDMADLIGWLAADYGMNKAASDKK